MKIFKNNIFHHKRVEYMSYKLNISEDIIEEALDLMYEYIKSKIEKEDPGEDFLTEEEFNNRFPTIHIPSLGYLKPSYKKYKHIYKNKKKKNGKTKSKS